jgi:hypothetical protein
MSGKGRLTDEQEGLRGTADAANVRSGRRQLAWHEPNRRVADNRRRATQASLAPYGVTFWNITSVRFAVFPVVTT